MLASGDVPVRYGMLSGGFAGTDQTVVMMQQLATGKWGSRSPKIRALAINILRDAGVPDKDYVGEMVAIHNWVRDKIRYTRDVAGQETLCPPEEIAFNSRAGDCDDMAMLDAALLGAVGIQTRFVTIGVTPDSFSHVYLEACPKGRWIPLDPIMKGKPAGWEAGPKVAKIRKVFPENIPQDTPMSTNGLGYVGDPRCYSHLDAEPDAEPTPAGYVVMDSMLDADAPIDQISRNLPAFPQQTYSNMGKPVANRIQANDQRLDRRVVADRVRADDMNLAAAERAAMNPMHGLSGPNGLMMPDFLAGVGANPDVQGNGRRMNRPALAQAPEGVDNMFTRPNMVLRPDRGDRVIYRGLYALNERPPIRPVTGVQGMGEDALPYTPADTMIPAAPSKTPTIMGIALLALGAFLYFKK